MGTGGHGGEPPRQTGRPLLRAYDLVKWFGETPALRGVSFSVAAGETVAITGPSGSGKSTLLQCVAGIMTPDVGEVWYEETPVHALSETRRALLRREHFGVVFQFGQLLEELTAEENVALPLLLAGRAREEALTAARQWLARLDVADCARQRPGQMSAGQMQRVAVARALVTSPKVLFADEPTGALDSYEGALVLRILLSAARTHGTTVVLVTHDPRVAAHADREIAVRDGQLEAAMVRA
ncbi:ABC transporter ATP-binding protein [Carbonactinospora thermoautotrophica]|uniref:ABC transporter ATP-binding protein n=1 Tax=Carbonactinospora thermoautotrophica TaxID=1469144 RepID=UPI0008336AF8|nr:ABC transporter ATP-binding protein [Carbonactinospora thermoautotrophica]